MFSERYSNTETENYVWHRMSFRIAFRSFGQELKEAATINASLLKRLAQEEGLPTKHLPS